MSNNRQAFWSVYTAYFGELREKDGMDEWHEFIDRCNIDDLCDAVRDLGESADNDSMRRPRNRLGQVKRAYWRKRKTSVAAYESLKGRDACAKCEGFAWLRVFSAGEIASTATMLRLNEYPRANESVWESMMPCVCSKGLRINRKHLEAQDGYGIPEEVHKDIARDYAYSHRANTMTLDLWGAPTKEELVETT